MPVGEFLLVDLSNSFTKLALSSRESLLERARVPTTELAPASVPASWEYSAIAIASVVPKATERIRRVDTRCLEVCSDIDLIIGIDYPQPDTIGADRLCNAAGCATLHGAPAIVVDAGTAVTFDVISAQGAYIGGVIAPGLSLMTEYLHERTALLPRIDLREPGAALGKSTPEAMLAGAFYGYRGMVREITEAIIREEFPDQRPLIVATGGDSELVVSANSLFDRIDPDLTLQGLRLLAARNL